MSVSFGGLNEAVVTFVADEDVAVGNLVKMKASGEVRSVGASDAEFIGVCIGLEGGYAVVQTAGFAELPYDGTAPAVGWVGITASAGKKTHIAASVSGRKLLCLTVNTTKKTAGLVL